jgi:hypothetical protein
MGAVGYLDAADAKDRKPDVLTQCREGAKQKTRKQRIRANAELDYLCERSRPNQSRSAQFLRRRAVRGNPTSSSFARNSSTVIGGFFRASLCNRAAAQNSSGVASRSSENDASGCRASTPCGAKDWSGKSNRLNVTMSVAQ